MNYLSVCSGIEATSVAWAPLGFHPVGFSEIDKFPCSVLSHHFPQVRNYGDMTQFREWDIEPGSVDVLVGGTPCQSFSIAGLRGGLADDRGNLTLTFLHLAAHLKPRYVVWENVPGILSDKTMALNLFLNGLEEVGYAIIGFDILDAQFHGLAQRRRRVFVCAQQVEDLLTRRTAFSGIIAIQCLAEIWRHCLAVLCEQWSQDAETSDSENSAHVNSLKKRIGLFGLQKAGQAQRLLHCLDALLPSSECGQSDSGSESGRASNPTQQAIAATKFARSAKRDQDISASENIEPSWKSILEGGLRIANECITSTSTNETTGLRIYSCAKAMLTIAGFTLAFRGSSPGYSTAAASCLIGLRDYIDYARLTSLDIFDDLGGDGRWPAFRREAESASNALGNLRTECFGEILPLADSMRRDSAKSGKKKQSVAALTATGVGTCGADDNQGQAGHLITSTGTISHCLNAGGMGRQDYETETMVVGSFRTAGDGAVYDSGPLSAPLTTGKDPSQNIIAVGTLRSDHSNIGNAEHCIAFSGRNRGDDGRGYDRPPNVTGEVAGAVDTVKPGNVAVIPSTPLLLQGFERIICSHANATKTNAPEVLRLLQQSIDSQEVSKRYAGELIAFWTPKVLQSDLHGEGVHREIQKNCPNIPRQVQSQNADGKNSMRGLRNENKATGRSSPGRKPTQQRGKQQGCAVQIMPYEATQKEGCLCSLWRTPEGARLLQQAFDSPEEARRSIEDINPDSEAMCDSWVQVTGKCQGSLRKALYAAKKIAEKGIFGVSYGVRRLTPL